MARSESYNLSAFHIDHIAKRKQHTGSLSLHYYAASGRSHLCPKNFNRCSRIGDSLGISWEKVRLQKMIHKLFNILLEYGKLIYEHLKISYEIVFSC